MGGDYAPFQIVAAVGALLSGVNDGFGEKGHGGQSALLFFNDWRARQRVEQVKNFNAGEVEGPCRRKRFHRFARSSRDIRGKVGLERRSDQGANLWLVDEISAQDSCSRKKGRDQVEKE